MTIRRATRGDYEACASLERQIFELHRRHRPDMFRALETPLPRERFEGLIGEGHIFLVAEESGRVIGQAFAARREYRDHPHMDDVAWLEIDDIVVDEGHRGRGVGTALFRAMEAEAKALGISRIELTVWGFNQTARRFYEKLGMRSRVDRLEIDL